MKNYLFFIPIAFCSIFLACNYNQSYETINYENQFQISIPGWVKKEALSDDALISYANRFRNFYFIVISEDKKSNFDTVQSKAFKRVFNTLDSAEFSSEKIMLQNLPTTHYTIKGKMGTELEKIVYELYLIEGVKKYYQVCIWTRGLERKKKYQADFDKIISSFKEI